MNDDLENYKIDRTMYEIFGCIGKTRLSHESAKNRARKYGMYYYECHICGKYHLTKQPTYESIMEAEDE